MGASSTAVGGVKHKHLGNYELLKTIGEGSFARVKLGIHRLTNQQVAVKIIDKEKLPDEYSMRNLHREVQVMRMLDHPNIIKLYEVIETKRDLCLVLEYAAGGEVLDYIVAHGRLKEPEARRFIRQIVSALHLHSYQDFGLSNTFDRSKQLSTFCGSPVYSAPELIEGKKYVGPEVDSWSLGINLYAMVVGDLPFSDSNLTALYESIVKCKYDLPEYLSPECKELISHLLLVNPKKRFTPAQVRDHTWLNAGTSILEDHSSGPKRLENESDLDEELLEQIESMGFDRAATIESVTQYKYNHIFATYHLLAAQKAKDAHKFSQDAEARKQAQQLNHHQDSESGEMNYKMRHDERLRAQQQGNDDFARIMMRIERQKADSTTEKPAPVGDNDPSTTRNESAHKHRDKSPGISISSSGALLNAAAGPMAVPAGTGGSPSSSLGSVAPTSSSSNKGKGHRGLPRLGAQGNRNGLHPQSALPPIPTVGVTGELRPHPGTLDLSGASSSGDHNNNGASPMVSRRGSTQGLVGRKRSTTISIDESLYLNKEQELEDPTYEKTGMTTLGVPRTIRFAFNCSTTSGLPAEKIFEKLKRALDKNGVQYVSEGFICEGDCGKIRLEAEVCKLPRLKMHGVRLKKISGDMWEYKNLCGKIVSDVEL
ncbi:kinase-like domain-containing protein [Cladochytrium replicatum]|nr:kinase-like domain-containing protein [Cladochytrium replicatum]